MTDTNIEVQNLINGQWVSAQTDRFEDVFNPSSGEVIAQVPLCSASDTDLVVDSAFQALNKWSQTPVVERARLMFRYRDLLEQNFDELARLVTREHGKTFAESKAEVRRGIEVVEFACGIPSLIMGQTVANIAADVDADVMRHPVGVCVGITPYNFPVMVPMWMLPIALTCGNSFVLKPSEKVPLAANRLGELLLEAGCPDGVFNIIHGGRDVVEALVQHDQVAAISFVGSSNVAKQVYHNGIASGKRVQAAGGAKNHFIIMPDADRDLAIQALAASSYGCSGQRCMATSVAVPVGGVADVLVDELCAHAASLTVGPTDHDESVDMGPVIRQEHLERVASYLDVAQEEGAQIALDGRRDFEGNGFLLGPSVIDQVDANMQVVREEIFGPVLSVMRATNLDEVLQLGKQCEFGNGASIFTRDGYTARQFREHFDAGMIGVNVGVPAPMAWFPFTGWNGSFFGDLHVQGLEGIQFYTRQKVTLTRWFEPNADNASDSIWKAK
jgi:malonate-semialdehyde dehydrogenase (acetylating) / methylmalonate-semialdehyde dehydrogenase